MRKIKLYKRSVKFIRKLPPKQQRQIVRSVQKLQSDVQPHDAKKLHGYDRWRVDVGEYRVIYWWDETIVHVIIIGKRNDSDVYRRLGRLAD